MKWGQRRYQNSDGTWTELGKERRRKGRNNSTTSDIPNTTKLNNYSGPAYFISSTKFPKEQVLNPRVPKNFFTDNGYEDANTPRVSFAPDIGKCLAGLSQNVEGKIYYVYAPDDISKYSVYKPNDKAVPDSKVTDELWVTNPVKIKLVKKIKVTGNEGKDGKIFSYGNHQAELYDDWIYEDVPLKHAYIYDEDSLMHHGVKGQKWGQRRYQNSDGTWTEEGKARRRTSDRERRNIIRNKPYTDDINDIVNTLSDYEKELLGADPNKDWIDKKYHNDTLKEKAVSFVTKNGDIPVSFVEVWTNGGRVGQISLSTRNDPEYRGKGYASKDVERAINWCDRYGKKSIDELEWIADRRNAASIAIGKKYGFVEDDPNKHGHDWKDDFSEEYAIMYRPVGNKNKN